MALYASEILRSKVLAAIKRDSARDERIRAGALRLARTRSDEPGALNSIAWAIVRQPDQAREVYAKALQDSEVAAAAKSEDWSIVNTLGVAQYRCVLFAEAAETLERSRAGNKDRPEDLAFLGMARFQLGEVESARQVLALLRERMREEPFATNEETQAFLREAEALIEQ